MVYIVAKRFRSSRVVVNTASADVAQSKRRAVCHWTLLALHIRDGRGCNNSSHLRTGKALNLSPLIFLNLWMGFEVIVQRIRKHLGELRRAFLAAQ